GTGPVVGVGATEREIALIDAIESPGWIGLRCVDRDDAVLFNIFDSKVLAQSFGLLFRHLDCEAVDRMLVNVCEFYLMRGGQFGGDIRGDREASSLPDDRIIEHHDVIIFNPVWVFAKFLFSALAVRR